MFKKMFRILLVFTLASQLISPVQIVNADEEYELSGIASETYYNEDESDEQEGEGEVQEVEYNDDKGKEESTIDSELEEDESESNEGLYQIGDIFPDAILAGLIASELELTADSYILLEDLATITSLSFWSQNVRDNMIESLAGMEHLINVEFLDFENHQIRDLSPLANLINLRELVLEENFVSDLSPLSGLINLTRLTLPVNQISDLTPLANLTNLTSLTLAENQVTDLRPLGNLNLQSLSVVMQIIDLPRVTVGEETQIEFFLPDGTRVEEFNGWTGDFSYIDGILTWHTPGRNLAYFELTTPIRFSANIYQRVDAGENSGGCMIENPRIPQETIDLMYALIENNSAENPLVIPVGSTVNEVINGIGWGEGITVLTPMSGLSTPEGIIYGAIILQHEDYTPGVVCHSYLFSVDEFFVQFENENTPTTQLKQNQLPHRQRQVIQVCRKQDQRL